MSRYIEIFSCDDCPHKDHKGAYGQIAYVPVCTLAGEELPYTVTAPRRHPTAQQTKGIPVWCPLPITK